MDWVIWLVSLLAPPPAPPEMDPATLVAAIHLEPDEVIVGLNVRHDPRGAAVTLRICRVRSSGRRAERFDCKAEIYGDDTAAVELIFPRED